MKAENKLKVLNSFMGLFENELDITNNLDLFNDMKKNLTKEIIINKYDSPIYISKVGTTMLLKETDSIEIGEYVVEGAEALVIDMGLTKEEAIALGEKVVLTELKGIVGFKDSDYAGGHTTIIEYPKVKYDEVKDIEKYSCACGYYNHKRQVGQICPQCQTEVNKNLPKVGEGTTIEIPKEEIVVEQPKDIVVDSSPSEETKKIQKQEDAAYAASIVSSIIEAGEGEVTYNTEGKPVDCNGVIIDDDKEDYYGIKILTDDNSFISPDINDYNNNYDALMEASNPVFLIENGNYVHVRGYNTVEETERLAEAELKRQQSLLGDIDTIIEENTNVVEEADGGAFAEKPVTIIGKEGKGIHFNIKKPIEIKEVTPGTLGVAINRDVEGGTKPTLGFKRANGDSGTIGKASGGFATRNIEVKQGTERKSIFGRVRSTEDVLSKI